MEVIDRNWEFTKKLPKEILRRVAMRVYNSKEMGLFVTKERGGEEAARRRKVNTELWFPI